MHLPLARNTTCRCCSTKCLDSWLSVAGYSFALAIRCPFGYNKLFTSINKKIVAWYTCGAIFCSWVDDGAVWGLFKSNLIFFWQINIYLCFYFFYQFIVHKSHSSGISSTTICFCWVSVKNFSIILCLCRFSITKIISAQAMFFAVSLILADGSVPADFTFYGWVIFINSLCCWASPLVSAANK